MRETVDGAKSVSWLQSRPAAFCGVDAFGTAGVISTRRVDSFSAKLPPCLLTRTILTRAVRDPPRVWASRTDFFEEKGSGFLNPAPNYRSRLLHQAHAPQPPPQTIRASYPEVSHLSDTDRCETKETRRGGGLLMKLCATSTPLRHAST